MKQWVQKKYNANLDMVMERYGVSKVFADILIKRGLFSWEAMDEYLYPSAEKMHQPEQLKDVKKAARLLREKVAEGKKIGIIGDYDVDGIMSTSILYMGLRKLGADVLWRIPHRVRDGYGIRDYMVVEMQQLGVDTLITCDNGISAWDAVKCAKELGMTVIITDHHEVQVDAERGEEILPPADAVIDAKQKKCSYPFKELCGSGVAYKLMECLWGREGDERQKKQLLSLAAIATVCDVVPLIGENRIIVKNGLEVLQHSENTGLAALIRQLDFKRLIGSSDLGFRIGPCLNAAGRLEDASKGVELLLEENQEKARKLAAELVQLNEERKRMTADAVDEAIQTIEREGYLRQQVLLVYLEDCSESVAGIVAGRIREKYYRPVMILTSSGECLKGSGRSIPGYHMQQALNHCSELLLEYGGHAMAAGFSLERNRLGELRSRLNEDCRLRENDLVEKMFFDRELGLGEVDGNLIQELELLQPVGEQNPGALFAKRGVQVCSVKLFGEEAQIGRFLVVDEGRKYTLIDFDVRLHMKKAICERYSQEAWEQVVSGQRQSLGQTMYSVDILYVPEINSRYGDIQYRVVDCR